MDQKDISLFLAVVRNGNFNAAASENHLTQSTLSKRIKKLEEELGFSLFKRRKGVKNVELSSSGIEFVSYAQRFQGLFRDLDNLRVKEYQPALQVGALDSIQPLTLRLSERIYQEKSDMRLRIHVRNSGAVYNELDRCLLDIGFSNLNLNYPSVQKTFLFSEPFVVVGIEDELPVSETVSPSSLNPDREVFTAWWSPGYKEYHELHWPRHLSDRLSTSSVHLQLSMLGRGQNCWCIMPYSLATSLLTDPRLVIRNINPAPPPRICYLLTRTQPREDILNLQEFFLATLHDIIHHEEPWNSTTQSASKA